MEIKTLNNTLIKKRLILKNKGCVKKINNNLIKKIKFNKKSEIIFLKEKS